jgi:hypothetical protein
MFPKFSLGVTRVSRFHTRDVSLSKPLILSRQKHTSPLNKSQSGQWPAQIGISEERVAHKSRFMAHATRLHSPEALPALLDHLVSSHSRLKRASHCMHAYRLRSTTPTGSIEAAHVDGGERGAGIRLADLLERGACEDVVVVVWRWYGGIPIGSARWRLISDVAREALERSGLWNHSYGSKSSKP